jgi:hypothetical protein
MTTLGLGFLIKFLIFQKGKLGCIADAAVPPTQRQQAVRIVGGS